MEPIRNRKMTLYILFMALGLVLIGLGVILFFIPILGALLLWSGQAMLIVNTVYRIHFFYSLSLDVDAVCIGDGRESGSYVAAAALSTLTFGLYNIYWTYKIGQRLHANAPRYGFKMVENGKDIALLDAFSFGYISAYELLKNMNKIAKVYNQNGANGINGVNGGAM